MARIKNIARKDSVKRSELNHFSKLPEIDPQEIFRRHFEAQFKPLPCAPKEVKTTVQGWKEDSEYLSSAEEFESEWDGISEEETEVQIIEHTEAYTQSKTMSKAELKSFMSPKPPQNLPQKSISSPAISDDDFSEAANLKNDLALQRLLSESHLLDSAQNPTLSGNNRHKAIDLRLQALGSRDSILKQQKMPMAHRRGIILKQNQRESKRRKEARENGIILEKKNLTVEINKTKDKRRDRGVGEPVVGKFSRGVLKLNKKDIQEIEGPRKKPFTKRGRIRRGSLNNRRSN